MRTRALLFYAAAWSALTLAVGLRLPWVTRFDELIEDAIYLPAARPVALFLTHAGDTVVIGALGLCLVVVLARWRAWQELRFVATAVAATLIVRFGVLWTVDRPRPSTAGAMLSFSYPSGHATYSCLAALLLVYLARPRQPGWLLIWPVTVSVSRVVLGVHWPLDVLAGLTLSGIMVCSAAHRRESLVDLRFAHG